jgi:hypothetical protein
MKSRGTLYRKSGCTVYRFVQVFLDRIRRHIGPPLHEVGHPVLLAMPVHDGRVFRPMADALAEGSGRRRG